MKYLPNIAGGLLGLLFVASSLVYFFGLVKMPPQVEGSPAALAIEHASPPGPSSRAPPACTAFIRADLSVTPVSAVSARADSA